MNQELETFIDDSGLMVLLLSIADICEERAHIVSEHNAFALLSDAKKLKQLAERIQSS